MGTKTDMLPENDSSYNYSGKWFEGVVLLLVGSRVRVGV